MQVVALLREQGADQERKWMGLTPMDVMAPSIPGKEEGGERADDTLRALLSHDTGYDTEEDEGTAVTLLGQDQRDESLWSLRSSDRPSTDSPHGDSGL
jgi:hypothetical protein